MKLDPPLVHLTAAVDSLIERDINAARRSISAIDVGALRLERTAMRAEVSAKVRAAHSQKQSRGQIGRSTGAPDPRQIYDRDAYTCRYAHCGRATVDPLVLRLVSRSLPEEFGYHPNWKLPETHLLYWTHAASFEHHEPWAKGGSNSAANIITACYRCNDAKSDADAGVLGWQLLPVPSKPSWSGLMDRYQAVSEALDSMGIPPEPKHASRAPTIHTDENSVLGDLVRLALPGRVQRRPHVVLSETTDSFTVAEMWRDGGVWTRAQLSHVLRRRDYPTVETIASPAPTPGNRNLRRG